MKLLFFSNLFPDASEPYRGLDNAVVLHHLARRCQIRVVSPRPTLPLLRWRPRAPRPIDQKFLPIFLPTYYLPKVGSRINHWLMDWSVRRTLLQALREFKFDAILSAWAYPDTCAIAQIARATGIPFAAITQGTDVHTYLEHPVRKRLIRQALNQASAVIARSADLSHRLQLAGIDPDRLHTIYNGVDPESFHPGDQQLARKGTGLPEDAEIVLFVGNFYPVKDPQLTLKAFAAFAATASSRPRLLVLVGGGPMEHQILRQARDLGIENKVRLAGRQTATAVGNYMRAADCLLLTSHNEGLPNVVLEAISCGLPVVATRVGGIPEVIHSPGRGSCVEGRDPAKLAAAIAAAVDRTGQDRQATLGPAPFDWEQTAESYWRLVSRAARSQP
jgi:teichuronic acid biosynthesis glycosyltransferase TuaC